MRAGYANESQVDQDCPQAVDRAITKLIQESLWIGLQFVGRSIYLRDCELHATRKEELAMFDTIIKTAGALLPGGVS